MKLHFYRDRNGKWRWTLYGRNGRKVANAGEGYTRRVDCERMARKILSGFTDAIIVGDDTAEGLLTEAIRRGVKGKDGP